MSESSPEQNPGQWNILAAIAAWVFPGLGHFLLGHVKRGLILAVTLGLLWTSGLLIGGVGVIDRHAQPFWFVGQMLIGPSLAVEAGRAQLVESYGPPQVGSNPAFTPSFGRAHEQGTLYVALAGLLNLMAVLDVLYRETRKTTEDDPRKQQTTEGPGSGPPTEQRHASTTNNAANKPGKPQPPTPPPSAIIPPPCTIALLAYRPLLDPLPIDTYWPYIPLVLLVAIVYKTIKLEDLRRLPREAGVLAAQITIFMVLIAVGLWLLVAVV